MGKDKVFSQEIPSLVGERVSAYLVHELISGFPSTPDQSMGINEGYCTNITLCSHHVSYHKKKDPVLFARNQFGHLGEQK